MAKNENGVWLDTESGEVVNEQPARGRQIVAPGKEITPNLQRIIDLYQANADTQAVEQATAPANVETRTTSDLADMTKAELLDEADRRGVEVAQSWTKGEILDALNG